MLTAQDYNTIYTPNWCPGCGNFGIWVAFKEAAAKQKWDETNTVITAGIGCHGHIINFTKVTSFEGLHGRPIPVACGIKMANHSLNVFVFTGDGDALAEGGNHFIHAARRNHNVTVILHDNAIYGLTTGQTSPTSSKGYKSKSTPYGNLDEPLHPLRVALAAGATFLARVYSSNVKMLADLIIKANAHQGFAVIQILQPCVTFNSEYTHAYYLKNIYPLDSAYDPANKILAYEKLLEWGEKKIPVGIIYQSNELSYEAQIPQIANSPLVNNLCKKQNLSKLLKQYT